MIYARYFSASFLLALLIVLSACGSQSVKLPGENDQVTPELMPTLQFIPKLETGKEGEPILYEAMPNPYIKRGRVKKSSVDKYILARGKFRKMKFSEADKVLLDLLKEDSSLSGPWVMRGDIAMQRKDTDNASKHYLKALTINSNNMNAWLRLAHAQRVAGQFIVAQNSYAQALAIWTDCPEAHLNLAVLYDVYLNLPLRAQKHMEAYVFLKGSREAKVMKWLEEIQKRTGVSDSLPLDKSMLKPIS